MTTIQKMHMHVSRISWIYDVQEIRTVAPEGRYGMLKNGKAWRHWKGGMMPVGCRGRSRGTRGR